ncbi:galactose oxidase [Aureibaculum marinum]|uniref:Galactose oxidase n=1 Tax=Aureibaculum marinum TaxID=2487930 RepID=A0A3N4NY30_9FLAO|nr:kelch repeat-containing protein [Aureibaculum marinum]RPE00816.1 galactose oxidase [Aureibaculum marinum]
MKNKIQFLTLIMVSLTTLIGCSDDDSYERGNWVQRSAFDGVARSNAVSFTINGYGYMGTGYDGDDYLNDFWRYNIADDYWERLPDFPGVARSSATGFSIDGKGYIGIGYDGDNELSDFWEYDPTTNQWKQIADFGGGARRAAIGFGVNNYGYVGTGYDGDYDYKDFWKYNPSTNEWSQILGFGGNKRRDGTAFIIDNMVYLGFGITNGIYQTDFWKFDPQNEEWTRLLDLDEEDEYSITRSNTVSFAVNGLGYVSTGYASGAITSTWEYDPINDDWEEITSLEATARQDAVSFYENNRAFVSLGRTGSLYLYDTYEIFPQEEYNDED